MDLEVDVYSTQLVIVLSGPRASLCSPYTHALYTPSWNVMDQSDGGSGEVE